MVKKSELSDKEKAIAEKIGHRISHLRTHHKLSQMKLAQNLDCPQSYISEWESGRKLVPARFMYRICEIFELKLEFFDPTVPHVENLFSNAKN